jgi:hypothetical protein
MSVLDPRKTYRNLKKKGFSDSENKSADHKYLELFHKNKLVPHTKISHGNEDIRNPLIRMMSFQCYLSKSEFIDLANCPLTKEKYLEILESKGLLE